MPDNRTDNLVQLAQDTARRITGSHTAWMAYLQTAARLYKYPYHEQLRPLTNPSQRSFFIRKNE